MVKAVVKFSGKGCKIRKFFLKETYAKSFRLFSSVCHGQSSCEVLIQAKVAKLESFLKENYGN